MVESIKHVVEALKHQPLTMTVLLLNVLFVTVFFWVFQANNERRQNEMDQILDRCLPRERGAS
jgi:hypothetical protein